MKTWQVGDVRITQVIELGGQPTSGLFFFPAADAEFVKRYAWLRPHFADEEGKLFASVHAFVIESQGRRIIVDTCVGNDKPRRVRAWDRLRGPFLQDLARAGHPAESIDTVVCTHLHVDHVGWNTRLADGRWVPTFANARYLFGRIEWAHWSAQVAAHDGQGDPPGEADVLADSVRPIVDAGLADLVEMDHRITDEVWLEPTPGHTPGHVSVHIASQGREAVITGDLMHHPIQCSEPDLANNFDSDREAARLTRRAFLARYSDRPVLVLGTHFAPPTGGWVVRAGEAWQFSVGEAGQFSVGPEPRASGGQVG